MVGKLIERSIPIPEGIVFGSDDESFSLAGSAIDDFADVDEVLGFLEDPVDFVIVAGAGIDHDVFVAVEEHESHLVVELVHGVEVGDFGDIYHVEGDEVAEFVCHFHDDLVHDHAGGVPVVPPTDHYQLLGLSENRLVDLPSVVQVRQQERHLKEIVRLYTKP